MDRYFRLRKDRSTNRTKRRIGVAEGGRHPSGLGGALQNEEEDDMQSLKKCITPHVRIRMQSKTGSVKRRGGTTKEREIGQSGQVEKGSM